MTTPGSLRCVVADVRGSLPDLVQAVGRALRMQPGEGKTASLVVPVLLGPGKTADNMLTSRAYGGLAKLLEALRAHDVRIIEQLAEQQARSRVRGVQSRSGAESVGGPRRCHPSAWNSSPPSACAGHDSVLGQRCCRDRSSKVFFTDHPAEAGAGDGQFVCSGPASGAWMASS
jgi:hypothetical protein